jgi:hypothetical protein
MRANALHYDNGKEYDVIDFCQHYKLSFNRGNVVKYIARAGRKDDELQDLYKAKDYIEREIAFVRELRNKEAQDAKEGVVSPYNYNYKDR